MNDFDDPIVKAATDADILDALQGIKLTQTELRDGHGTGMTLAFFLAYFEKLPEDVVHRLTEIDTEAVARLSQATGLGLTGDALGRFSSKLASDVAFAQVIRAANVYRAKIGYNPLGSDGCPERKEGPA